MICKAPQVQNGQRTAEQPLRSYSTVDLDIRRQRTSDLQSITTATIQPPHWMMDRGYLRAAKPRRSFKRISAATLSKISPETSNLWGDTSFYKCYQLGN